MFAPGFDQFLINSYQIALGQVDLHVLLKTPGLTSFLSKYGQLYFYSDFLM